MLCATVITDEFRSYNILTKKDFIHLRVDHTKNEYVKDGFSTNRNENWNSTMKRMIKGTHIHVSRKHLAKYVAENTFRYVNRKQPEMMFEKILSNV